MLLSWIACKSANTHTHTHTHSLIGVCTQKDQIYIVMEFMPGGAFLDFLRKKGAAQTKSKLCSMVIDASKVRTNSTSINVWAVGGFIIMSMCNECCMSVHSLVAR